MVRTDIHVVRPAANNTLEMSTTDQLTEELQKVKSVQSTASRMHSSCSSSPSFVSFCCSCARRVFSWMYISVSARRAAANASTSFTELKNKKTNHWQLTQHFTHQWSKPGVLTELSLELPRRFLATREYWESCLVRSDSRDMLWTFTCNSHAHTLTTSLVCSQFDWPCSVWGFVSPNRTNAGSWHFQTAMWPYELPGSTMPLWHSH